MRAAATLTLDHPAAHPVRATQHAGRAGQVSTGHGAANPGARHLLIAEAHRRHHVDVEPVLHAEPAEGLDVAASPAAEPVIVPDDQLLHPAAVEQDASDELLGTEPRHPPVEPQQHHVVELGLGQELAPFRSGHQDRRRRLRVDHLERMRLEGNENAGPAGGPRAIGDLAEHGLMTQVHAVERADGDGAAIGQLRHSAHGTPSTTDGRSHPSSALATATSSSPRSRATSPSIPSAGTARP